MTRNQLEHIIRAAAAISEDDEIVIFGSQAVLGQYPDSPADLTVSMEADVFPRNKPERSDLIDGSIGEGSPFHETFGYYAQGIDRGTAVLPEGWEQRLVVIRNPNTDGHAGLCLEIHDLLISKCVAGRDKDFRFLRDALRSGLASPEALLERLDATPLEEGNRERIRRVIKRESEFDGQRPGADGPGPDRS